MLMLHVVVACHCCVLLLFLLLLLLLLQLLMLRPGEALGGCRGLSGGVQEMARNIMGPAISRKA